MLKAWCKGKTIEKLAAENSLSLVEIYERIALELKRIEKRLEDFFKFSNYPYEFQQILACWEDGKSIKRIAKDKGVSPLHVCEVVTTLLLHRLKAKGWNKHYALQHELEKKLL